MTDIVTPTPIDELPPAPQPTDTPAEFNVKGFATVAAQAAMVPQINTANSQTYQNATAAKESAAAAAADRVQTAQDRIATGQDRVATGQDRVQTGLDKAATAADRVQTGQDRVQTGLDRAATADDRVQTGLDRAATIAARDQAEIYATSQLKATSTTSVTPGAGAKAFTVEPSRSFVAGMYLVATSQSDIGTSMSGYVQSYDIATGALVIAVDMFSGAGAKADWVIGVAAPGASSGLTRQIVTANTTCVAGVAYIVAASGITLTLPTTWNAGDKIAVIEAIGDVLPYSIAFGSTKLRTRTMGTQQIDSAYGSTGVLTYQDATRGLV